LKTHNTDTYILHYTTLYYTTLYYTTLYTTYMASFSPGLVLQVMPSLARMTAQLTVVKTNINLNYV